MAGTKWSDIKERLHRRAEEAAASGKVIVISASLPSGEPLPPVEQSPDSK